MHQMKPVNWLLLLLYFTIMFIFKNIFFNYSEFLNNTISKCNLNYMKVTFK